MKAQNSKSLIAVILMIALFIPTLVRAADTEEVSYDDLVNQLSSRKRAAVQDAYDPLDNIKIHTGFGLITSAANVSAGNSSSSLYMSGFQLSAGIDLFSPNWIAEGVLRNFGQTSSGSESHSMREYDLKALYRNQFSTNVAYRIGGGIGTRTLKISDASNGVSVNDSTPLTVFVGGIDVLASQYISFGIEAGLRTAMVTSTADKSSGDLTLHVDASF